MVGSGFGDTREKVWVSPSNTMRMAMLAMPSLFFASFSVRSRGCLSSSQYTSMTTSASCSIWPDCRRLAMVGAGVFPFFFSGRLSWLSAMT